MTLLLHIAFGENVLHPGEKGPVLKSIGTTNQVVDWKRATTGTKAAPPFPLVDVDRASRVAARKGARPPTEAAFWSPLRWNCGGSQPIAYVGNLPVSVARKPLGYHRLSRRAHPHHLGTGRMGIFCSRLRTGRAVAAPAQRRLFSVSAGSQACCFILEQQI
jgi:hypothetical protein